MISRLRGSTVLKYRTGLGKSSRPCGRGAGGLGPRRDRAVSGAKGAKGALADAWRAKHGDWAVVGKGGWLSTHRDMRDDLVK